MFLDFKTGGYNLESTYAEGQRLIALILLIAIAYTCAILTGPQSRKMGGQKYLDRLQELKRTHRRHSTFWLGLYGCLWVGAIEFWFDLAISLMRLKPGKLPHFKKGLRGYDDYSTRFVATLSPRQEFYLSYEFFGFLDRLYLLQLLFQLADELYCV